MDPQTVLDTALSAGAAQLGSAEAAKIFREQLKTTLRVNVNLTPGQRAMLKKIVDFPVVFTGGKMVTNDHPVLVACRDLVRDVFESEFKIEVSKERTLIVGSAAREIKRYSANPFIHYYIYGKENKDYDRIVRPALQSIVKSLKEKAKKTNFMVFIPPEDHPDRGRMRPSVKRYWQMEEILKDYVVAHKMPANIHTELIEANTLVFEDSFYNYTPEKYLEIFEKTGAQIAYGYGLLPLELLFPDMPENPLYSVSFRTLNDIELATLVFRNGYCNGYVHELAAWKTLLQSPVIRVPGNSLTLAVEITSRVGPMACFKIYRCKYPERIARAIQLTERQQYVRILKINDCIDKKTGKVCKDLKYFSMLAHEYEDVVNYLLGIDPKSMTYQTTVSYIRRRMGGMSLITKELIEPWYLPKRLVPDAALTIFLDCKLRTGVRNRIVENINLESVSEKIMSLVRNITRTLIWPIDLLLDWLMAGNLTDQLVLDMNGTQIQYSTVVPDYDKEELKPISVGLYLDNPYEGDVPDCPICLELMGKMGDQIVNCQHKVAEKITLKLTDAQIGELRTKLIDTDEDPTGLAAVKKRCLENLPMTGFEHSVKMFYIKAGPGCGKSYLIRQMATTHDLVLAPFTKLRPDYTDLKTQDGESYDLLFKTMHRAMETRGCKRIFVDEFTCLPYEYLASVAFINGAEEIILVGDDKQTKVSEPSEGLYIGNYIDLTKLSTHELIVNFRNPVDTVAILNKVYGYKMQAYSKIQKSIEFVKLEELPKDLVAVKMAFSKNSAKTHTECDRNTVRANQGGTHKVSVLFLTNLDANVPSAEELQIVGLSRHTEKLYIVHDECNEYVKLREKLSLDTEFYEHMQQWLTFPNETVKPVLEQDKVVDLIISEPHPPKDVYLFHDTFLPSAAYDDVTTSMNLISSAKVPELFSTGTFNPDLVLMPVNKRKHPTSLAINYFSICSGVGNHFSAKSPVQVLQVLQARYFNKQLNFPLDHKNQTLAVAMVNLWFKEHVVENFRSNIFDDAEITEVLHGFLKKVGSQHYQEAFSANGGSDNPDGRAIRFELKGIFKPKHGDVDVDKAGQGISAWSTDACAMFCSIFRILTRLSVKNEKPHVVTDSYMTEHQFMNTVSNKIKTMPRIAKFATTDGITFDANQNAFTQLIEKLYWRAQGVPEDFLEHYYSFRKNYKIISSVAIGFAGTQKTSGEPGTLANNGAVSKIVSNFIVRGEGPMVVVYKGDDFTKQQLNLKLNKDNELKVNGACSLGLRVNISESTDFCGLMFSEGNLFPSVPRKVNKICAHRFRSYQHFCEYQDSLRNWVQLINGLGTTMVIGANAAHYETTFDEMEMAFEFVNSVSHINRDQFLKEFKHRRETAVIPVVGDTFNLVEQSGPADSFEEPTVFTRKELRRQLLARKTKGKKAE